MKENIIVTEKLKLEEENLRLNGEVVSLNEKLLRSDERALKSEKEVLELKQEVLYLKEQLEYMKRKLFGRSSEKTLKDLDDDYYCPNLLDVLKHLKGGRWLTEEDFNQLRNGKGKTDESDKKDEAEESITIEKHERKKNKKREHALEYPEDLPVEVTEIDLPEDQKICPETGVALVRIGEEVSQRLAMKPAHYFIKKVIRFKYAYPKSSEQEGVKVPALPELFLPKPSSRLKRDCRHLDEEILRSLTSVQNFWNLCA